MKKQEESIKILKRLYSNGLERLYIDPIPIWNSFDLHQCQANLFGVGESLKALGFSEKDFDEFKESLLVSFEEKYKKFNT